MSENADLKQCELIWLETHDMADVAKFVDSLSEDRKAALALASKENSIIRVGISPKTPGDFAVRLAS